MPHVTICGYLDHGFRVCKMHVPNNGSHDEMIMTDWNCVLVYHGEYSLVKRCVEKCHHVLSMSSYTKTLGIFYCLDMVASRNTLKSN